MFNTYLSSVMKRATSHIVLGVFLASLLGSLFIMSANAGGMSSHCIFAADSQTLCAMDVQDHIVAWQNTFISIVPLLFGLLLVVIANVFSRAVFQKLSRVSWVSLLGSHVYLRLIQERCYSWFYRPLQDLCSRGIMHPILYG